MTLRDEGDHLVPYWVFKKGKEPYVDFRPVSREQVLRDLELALRFRPLLEAVAAHYLEAFKKK